MQKAVKGLLENQGRGHAYECIGEYIWVEVSIWDGDKVLSLDTVAGCTILWVYLIPQNCTLRELNGGT